MAVPKTSNFEEKKNSYKRNSDGGIFQLSGLSGAQRHKHMCLIHSILVMASSVLPATAPPLA